jgi:sugar phosphate isomerase/epimerase
MMLARRDLLSAAVLTAGAVAFGAPAEKRRIPLGFSLYGMRDLAIDDACRACAELGYECVELPVMAQWPADAMQLSSEDIGKLATTISAHKLRVSALMENLVLAADNAAHGQNLERLKAAAKVAHKVETILIETVLGGAPKDWMTLKARMVERLKDWAKLAERERITIAIKAHVGGAAHLPEHLLWLLDEVQSDSIAAVYDPSHFVLRGLSIADSWRPLAKVTKFIHIKDAGGAADQPKFLLPGAGKLDLGELFRELHRSRYAGDVLVEVSGQLHSQPEYDPRAAAKESFAALQKARVE